MVGESNGTEAKEPGRSGEEAVVACIEPFALRLQVDAGLASPQRKAFTPSVVVLSEFFLAFIGSLLWEDLGCQG